MLEKTSVFYEEKWRFSFMVGVSDFLDVVFPGRCVVCSAAVVPLLMGWREWEYVNKESR